jgi:hypothetical protein
MAKIHVSPRPSLGLSTRQQRNRTHDARTMELDVSQNAVRPWSRNQPLASHQPTRCDIHLTTLVAANSWRRLSLV